MNERFKFRVWDKKHNEYIPSNMISTLLYFGHKDEFHIEFECFSTFADSLIIEQCTGLKDKNGNLIYEGDIVLFNDDDYPWQIKWNEVFARWVLYSPLGSNEDGEEELTDTDTEYLEIIGNIHEQKDTK